MPELRFPRDLYAGEAIDEAVKRFDRFATFALSNTESEWVVAMTPHREEHTRRIVGEFGNFVLGKTIDRGGAR